MGNRQALDHEGLAGGEWGFKLWRDLIQLMLLKDFLPVLRRIDGR